MSRSSSRRDRRNQSRRDERRYSNRHPHQGSQPKEPKEEENAPQQNK